MKIVHEWLSQMADIPGDVDFSVGNISFGGDVNIHKSVLDLFRVTSQTNITIGGTIEAAEVHAGQNLIVRGGIVGKDNAHVVRAAGGKFLLTNHANLR